jgi:putative hydrolase of the HAD superfamily
LFDDAIPTLERFAESGLAIGIVSNSDFDLWPVLKKLGIDTLVDIALPTISLGIEKPHPEAYRSACRELGVAPQDAVFIGDNVELDGYGALAAGLRPILIDREGIHQNLALAFPVVTDLLAAWPLVTPR